MVKLSLRTIRTIRTIQKHYNNLCISKLFTYPNYLKTFYYVKSYYFLIIFS